MIPHTISLVQSNIKRKVKQKFLPYLKKVLELTENKGNSKKLNIDSSEHAIY